MSMISGARDYGRFDELADEFARRYREGERPSLQEYINRFPEMADEIRELFPAFIEVEQADEARQDRPNHGKAAGTVNDAMAISQVGDYRVLREVGRGGMGVVYEAEQISLRRRVALKVLPRQIARDRTTLERFRREARAAARLHHTNIVPVFEVGHDGDIVFYAMQFIQGQGLDLVIDELARLRAGSGGSDFRELSAARKAEIGRAEDNPSFAGESAVARTLAGEPACFAGDLRLSQVAHSLVTGRFAHEGHTPAVIAMSAPERVNHARLTTDRVDPEATAGFEDGGQTRVREAVDDPGTKPASREPGVSESLLVSDKPGGSAVFPGGTQISSIESSSRRLPFFRSVSQIGSQVALGLAYAHARGVVHRDIKPSNLLLDTAGVVWITDFGLAKSEEDGLTATGDILGTLRYMAPERFRGEGDARADVYALGLTIYELLTLRPAFGASDRLRLVEQIKTEEPIRPRKLDHLIPRDLETIVLKAIDKDPARRYSTAAALADDLQRFIDDEPIEARRASYIERLARWARHHKEIAASLSALAALLLLTAIVAAIAAAQFRNIAGDMTRLASERNAESLKALDAKAQAEAARNLADERRETAVRTLYFAKADLVSDALDTPLGRSQATSFLMGWRGLDVRNDPRAWEWYYLQSPPARERMTLRGHRVDVNTVAVSPDGTRIASGGFSDAIRIWDTDTGKQVLSIPASTRGVLGLAWSPDGTRIAEAATDHLVRVWDATLGLNMLTLAGHDDAVCTVAWSPDGTRLASAGNGDLICIWDAQTGRALVKTRAGHRRSGVQWNSDGSRLATWETDTGDSIVILNPVTGAEVKRFRPHPGGAVTAVSPDETRIVYEEKNGDIRVCDSSTGKDLATVRNKGEGVSAFAWSKDGTRLAVGYGNGLIAVVRTQNWEPRLELDSPTKVLSLSWSADGRRLVSGHGGWNGEVKIWQVDRAERSIAFLKSRSLEDDYGRRCVTWSPHGAKLAFAKDLGTLEVWDSATGRSSTFPELGKSWPMAVAWSPDARRLAVGFREGDSLRILDTTSNKMLAVLNGHSGPISTISWSPDGRRLVTGALAHTATAIVREVIVWDAATSRRLYQLSGMGAYWSPDGSRIAVAADYQVSIHDAATGATLATWHHPSQLHWSLCWSPDSRFVAGSFEREAHIWEAATGRLVATLAGHSGNVNQVAWSPEGKRLATASGDGTVRLWDVESGTPVFTLRACKGEALSVDWSADGLMLAAGGHDGTITVWDATSGSEIDRNPAFLSELDARLISGPSDLDALHWRADLHARAGLWDEAAADYERIAKISGVKCPEWFVAGWWSATKVVSLAPGSVGDGTIADPFATVPGAASRPEEDSTRPRWYTAATEPNGYLPLSANPPLLMTRVYCPADCELALAVENLHVRFWLNGQPLRPGPTVHPVSFRRGWNTLVARPEVSKEDSSTLTRPRTGLYIQLSSAITDRAAAYLAYDQPRRAIDLTTEALRHAPDDPGLLLLAYRTWRDRAEALLGEGNKNEAEPVAQQAFELLGRLLELRPGIASLTVEVASLLTKTRVEWSVLEPVEIKSAGGATLTRQPDGSILASGPNPDLDTYTFSAKTSQKRIAGIQFEALKDPSLPANGPGRHPSGYFTFEGLFPQFQGSSTERPEPVRLATAALTRRATWIWPVIEPVGDGREGILTLVVKNAAMPKANVGRFRLSATTFPDLDLLAAMHSANQYPVITSPTALGLAELMIGNPAGAIARLRHASDQSSLNFVTDELLLSVAHERLGETGEARPLLDRALDQIAKGPPDERLLPLVLVKALIPALASSPDDLRMLSLRARALHWQGARESAATDYRRAAALDPTNPEWPRRLAQLGADVIEAWNFDFGLEGWQAENQVTLVPIDGSFLRVESKASHPEIKTAISAPAGKLTLSIRARLIDRLHAHVFWNTRNGQRDGSSSEGQRPLLEMPPTNGEWRQFEVSFQANARVTGVGLDLGGAVSRLDIDSIVLRSIP